MATQENIFALVSRLVSVSGKLLLSIEANLTRADHPWQCILVVAFSGWFSVGNSVTASP